VDSTKVLTIDKLPKFIEYFLSSKYVAHWLGVRVSQIDEIREFALENYMDIDLKFIRLLFAEYQLKDIENNFDDRLKVEDVANFVTFVLDYFEDLEDFFAEREEVFYLELVFQLPFINNSSFPKIEKERFLSGEKALYYASFRQSYTGSFVITRNLEDIISIFDDDQCFVSFYLDDTVDFEFYLVFPKILKSYWVAVIEKVTTLSGYLVPFEISNC
jgi:hypothetical protein